MAGISISNDVKVKISIKRGSVYYFYHEDFPENPHYFIVLNKEPLNDDSLLLVVATSQIEKKREYIKQRRLPETTLVVVEKNKYKHFSEDTVFNCNTVHLLSLSALIEKVSEVNRFFLEPLPDEIVKDIINGITSSRLIEENIKKQLN